MNEEMKKLVFNDIVRLNDSRTDKDWGLGIVKNVHRVPDLYRIEFQDGTHCDIYITECRRIGSKDEVFNHCQSLLDCIVNPIDAAGCGLQDNYCNDDECNCAICPFNNHNPMKCPTCIEDGHRESWFYESDPGLVKKTKSIINFLMSN
jgi:hypothetical protein